MKQWIEAARLRTLPLSLSGIFLGTLLAKWKGNFDGTIFILSCLVTLLFQILSNFANDYGDGMKGTDNENRIGPQRTIQSGAISPNQMRIGMIITVFISLLLVVTLLYVSFLPDHWNEFFIFIALGISSIIAALFYTMGKNPYGYIGLGDFFVFIFFGLLAVIGSEYLYTKTFDINSLLPASAIGFFSVAVLNLNNMRDIESDRLSNKKTLAMRMGFEKAKYYQLFLMNIPFILALIFLLLHKQNFTIDLNNLKSLIPFGFMLLYIPATYLRRKIIYCKEPKELDLYMKPTALLALAFAIIFGIGLSL